MQLLCVACLNKLCHLPWTQPFAFSCPGQMDPKLRPSFPDIVKYLEEVLACLKVEEVQHEGVSISGDNDKKTTANGNSKGVMPWRGLSAFLPAQQSFSFTAAFSHKGEQNKLVQPVPSWISCPPTTLHFPCPRLQQCYMHSLPCVNVREYWIFPFVGLSIATQATHVA